MLHEFLTANRDDLIDRCRLKVVQRRAPKATDAELEHGVPLFLDQLVKTLRVERTIDPGRSREVSGPSGGEGSVLSEIGATAARHGRELLQHGFTVDQVVHDYGDLCQAITDLAFERHAPFEVDEFRTLNRCLDNAIADSVTEFSYQRDLLLEDAGVHALNDRLGFLAHELRSLIQTATLAVTAIKAGNVGLAGATGAVLDRSLIGLRNLVDRSLADVRVTAGMPPRHQLLPLAQFIGEVKISASLEAQARGCGLVVWRRRSEPRGRGRPRPAVLRDWKPAAKRVQVHRAEHRGLVERSTHRRSHPDRSGGQLRRPAPGDAEKMFRPLTRGQQGKVRPRARAVDLPAQRRGERRGSQRAQQARLGLRLHHRAPPSRRRSRGNRACSIASPSS